MVENKTQKNDASVEDVINLVDDKLKKQDSLKLLDIFKETTGDDATMRGPSIVGFGSYHYKYPSGREGDSLRVGFAPRRQALTIYGLVMYDLMTTNNKLLKKHGDWMELGSADKQKPAKDGTVEAWGRSASNPVGGWYGLKKGLRGCFGVYMPPLLEELRLAEVEHNPRGNRMRAI